MTNILEQHLLRACEELGINISIGYCVQLDTGVQLCAAAHLPTLGSRRGMLIFKSSDEIEDSSDDLVRVGFGYSVIQEPKSDEQFDLDGYREMFEDWGWHGQLTSEKEPEVTKPK